MFAFDDLSSVSLQELTSNANWQSQYRLITQWGKLIHHKPELRLETNLLRGCETLAWLTHVQKNDLHYFSFDSDSKVINGLAALLLSQVNGKTATEIGGINLAELLSLVGLEKHLTPSRNNGLRAIIARVDECVKL
ncbi:cysteine desulfurase, sulfur acceptor subunit CsdE [Cellvibrio zantedeschiae]|uniref:Cysteine desulfurase, sulfur acceptor subunit CsdE n=1 Tax=Cellvibrio zantedeschiae TaxID=1237077 RepID=A0ABQ3B5Z6_9GAMM|nr:SufE family protein [Cellvibrio zantedeschiae]GGY75316.1 cysteine desulfurase, sulfur acceptor subunit CsdE [Cellvibrio zantedeschiae]